MAKILIVEDEPDIRANLRRFLLLEGHSVLEAADGLDGVEKAHSGHPDLILCDISMPYLDGYAVLEKVRQEPELRETPFVFLTASAERYNRTRGIVLGADDYVTKPFDLARLRELIARLTGAT